MSGLVKPLLIGEANPYGSNPSYAIYPDPPGCAGYRLCHKVMGIGEDDYLARFDRVNLCAGKWSGREASTRASALWCERRAGVFVLLGARVSRAFQWPFEPFKVRSFSWAPRDMGGSPGVLVVTLPHPSGLSRAWHVPGAYERARAVLREAGVLSTASAQRQ